MNLENPSSLPPLTRGEERGVELSDHWILSRYHRTIQSTTKALESYQFSEMAMGLYEFFWHEYCDWYLELIKPRITNHALNQVQGRITVLPIAFTVLEGSLRLLHPIMPFLTEEIWQKLPNRQVESIMVSSWPEADSSKINKEAEEKIGLLIQVITSIRNIRSEMNIPPHKEADCLLKVENNGIADFLKDHVGYLKSLAKANKIQIGLEINKPKGSASAVLSGVEVYLPLEGLIDFGVERRRIEKEISKISSELDHLNQKLEASDFLSRAPDDIVEETKAKKTEFEKKLSTLKNNLKSLEDV